MNLSESAIVLRPRSVAEVFDLACRVCCSSGFWLYLRLSALVLLPTFTVCLALRYALGWEWVSVWIIAIVLATIAQGIFTVAVGRLLVTDSLTARQVLSAFQRRFIPYLGSLILSRLLLAASCLPVFVLLPVAWIHVLFMHEASLLEGGGPLEALRRSSRFIKNRGTTAFQVLSCLLLAQAGCTATGEFLGDGLMNGVLQLGNPFGSLLEDGGSPFALLGYLSSIPFVATARFLQYIDTRTRVDGWDVQVRFMAIAAKDASERRLAA